MPKLGLTMTEGTLAEWLVKPGATFTAGTALYIVESDKVATEIEAEADGRLLETVLPEGETVDVGTVIAYWEAAGPDVAARAAAAPPPAPPAAGSETAGASRAPPRTGSASVAPPAPPASPAALVAPAPLAHPAPPAPPAPASSERLPVTPYARRRARELSVDLRAVAGTGPGGRVQARDVERAAPAVHAPAPPAAAAPKAVRPSATQQTMARRLTMAKQQVPHFYLALEAEVSALLALRHEFNARGEAPKLTLNHLLVAAVGRALRDEPQANRVWADEGIVAFERSDVGIAVDTDRGLLVPVLRDAGRLPLAAIAQGATDLVDRTRAGSIAAEEMSGGSVTVSNAGMLNVTYMTPIINPGQAMVLGVGSVRELFRPDAQGRPALRRELGLVLAADHRILSGAPALRFLNAVVRRLEQPAGLFTDPPS